MATINKQMKTFNVPSGNDTKCYEIVDDKGRKCLAKDWATNSSSAFAVGEYVIKDGVCYKFTSAHTAGSAWSASEVVETNLGDEITGLKSAVEKKADVIDETVNTPSAVVTFADGADDLPMALKVAVDPVQDLHGYDNPWPAGGGKNLLNITLVNGSHGNLTWEIQKDSASNITGVKFNGSHSDSSRYFPKIGDIYLEPGNYYLSGGINAYCSIDIEGGIGKENNSPSVPTPFTVSTAGTYPVYFAIFGNRTFNNEVAYPMIRLSSVSDATFAPYSNICPISGWTVANVTRAGKNLIKVSADTYHDSQYCTYEYTDSGVAVTATGNFARAGFVFSVKKGQTYTLSFKGYSTTTTNRSVYVSNGEWAYSSEMYASITLGTSESSYTQTFTATTDVLSIAFYATSNSSSGTMYISDLQLEIGSSATSYTPFVANDQYPITFPTSAGTVYGGTLTLNQDGTGTLVVNRASVDLGTLSWRRDTTIRVADGATIHAFYANVNDCKIIIGDSIPNMLSSVFRADSVRLVDYGGGSTIRDFICSGADLNHRIWAYGSIYNEMSPSEFGTAMSGVQIVYELAIPITYSLTPVQVKTLLSVNNIWADTGDILSVDYPADTKLYIDKLISNLQALVLENIGNT